MLPGVPVAPFIPSTTLYVLVVGFATFPYHYLARLTTANIFVSMEQLEAVPKSQARCFQQLCIARLSCVKFPASQIEQRARKAVSTSYRHLGLSLFANHRVRRILQVKARRLVEQVILTPPPKKRCFEYSLQTKIARYDRHEQGSFHFTLTLGNF